jgi:hypothetical protein
VEGIESTDQKMKTPKTHLSGLEKLQIDREVGIMLDDPLSRFRLKQFFVNEYYPAIIHTDGKMVVLEKTVDSLIARGALSEYDREIVRAVVEHAPEWFASAA